MGYRVEIVEVTPEMAEDLFSRNYHGNRSIRNTYVNQLSEVMRHGRFISENGQTLIVGDDDGILYDGQHRLLAIIKSGKTYRFIIAYITEGKEKYKTIDNGTRRRAADFIDLPEKDTCAALARVMSCVEWGRASLESCLQGRFDNATTVDRGLQVLYCEQKPDFVTDCVCNGKRIHQALGCGKKSDISTFIALVRYFGEDVLLEEFIDDFTSDLPSNITVNACKDKIKKVHYDNARRHIGDPDKTWMIGTLLDAYSHYCAMDNRKTFKMPDRIVARYSKKLDKIRQSDSGTLEGISQ